MRRAKKGKFPPLDDTYTPFVEIGVLLVFVGVGFIEFKELGVCENLSYYQNPIF